MQVAVIGNGLSGSIFSKTLRELDSDVCIDVYGDEKYLYYPRPNLIEFMAGNIPYERLFAFNEDWYQERNINLRLGNRVEKIIPGSQQFYLANGTTETYDYLLLANGAFASLPPIKGADKTGVFTLRKLDDALAILDYLEGHQNVAVIGGGLLGLEIARAIRNKNAQVDVYEFFPRLLPRQLDPEGASILTYQIEKMGIKVHVGVTTEEIMGETEALGLRFKDGKQSKADMVIIAAGVRPYVNLAKEAGLETNKGVIVDDFLQTSAPNIYAAGDNVEHKGRIYGIIPASFQQARAAAYNLFGQKQNYEGTIPSNTLKVMGLEVTSMGLVYPEAGGFEEFSKQDAEAGIYKKLVLEDGVLAGAIWLGTKQNINEVSRLVAQKQDVSGWKAELLEDDFDFSVI